MASGLQIVPSVGIFILNLNNFLGVELPEPQLEIKAVRSKTNRGFILIDPLRLFRQLRLRAP